MLSLRSLAAVECIEILKEFGVDESMTDADLATAYDRAEDMRNSVIKNLLDPQHSRLGLITTLICRNDAAQLKLILQKRDFQRKINSPFPFSIAYHREFLQTPDAHQNDPQLLTEVITLLRCASYLNREDCLRVLKDNGADMADPVAYCLANDVLKSLPSLFDLHTLLRSRDANFLDTLLAHHPGLVNEIDENGDTPLLRAVKSQDFHCVRVLLSHKADESITDQRKQTPYDLADDVTRSLLNPSYATIGPFFADEEKSEYITVTEVGQNFLLGHFQDVDLTPVEVMVKLKKPDRNFEAETALYDFVKHENGDSILQCYHHQLDYLVLEHFGEDLRSFYQADVAVRTGPLLNEILSAVHSLHHGLGYVHGDLQPESVRISESHGRFSCKLCHFDNACRVGEEFPRLSGHLRITETWTCPELHWAHHNRAPSIKGSFQMDIFNLGLIVDILCQPAADLTPNKSVLDANAATRENLFRPENENQFFQSVHCLRHDHWFGDLLRTMLSFDPKKRSDIQIYRESFREKTISNLFHELRRNQEERHGGIEEGEQGGGEGEEEDYVLDPGLDPYLLYLSETVVPELPPLPFADAIRRYMSWDRSGRWLEYFVALSNRLSTHQCQVLHAALDTIHAKATGHTVSPFVRMISEFAPESWQDDEVALANVVMTSRRHDDAYLREQSRFYHPQATKKPKRPSRSNNSSLRPSLTSVGEEEECVFVELEKEEERSNST